MPSIGTYKAQPRTRTFVMTQDSNSEQAARYFDEATIVAWIANNSLTAVGNLVTVPATNFASVMEDLNSDGTFTDRKNLTDLGAEYVIGNEINSRIIVLRKVLGQENASVGALGGKVSYICVENDSTITDTNFLVCVARV